MFILIKKESYDVYNKSASLISLLVTYIIVLSLLISNDKLGVVVIE